MIHGRQLPKLRPDWGNGSRAAVGVALSFGIATLISGLETGVFAALGCYFDAYGNRDPYPRRARLLIAITAGAAAAFFAGQLAATNIWLAVVALPAVAFAATLFVRSVHLSGPGSYRIIVIAAMSAFLPSRPDRIPLEAGYLLFGAGITWLLSMSGWLWRPFGPEEQAVATAYRRVADFTEAARRDDPATHPLPATRQTAYLAVNTAWTAIDDTRRGTDRPTDPRRSILYALLCRLESVLDDVQTTTQNSSPCAEESRVPPYSGERLRTAADEVSAGHVPEAPPGRPPAAVRGRSPSFGSQSMGPGLLGEADLLWPVPLPPRKSIGAELRRMFSTASPAPALALRLAYAVAAGAVLGALLPLIHPSWVTIGAASALQGGPSQRPLRRTVNRLGGTVIGVVVTALVFLTYQPGVWMTVAIVTVVHAAARTVASSSMFLGVALGTPLALLLASAGNPDASLSKLATYRLLDLTLGVLLGLAAALLVPGVPLRRVYAATSQAVRETGLAIGERLRTGALDDTSEALAWQRSTDLWAMHASVHVEEIRSTHTADWMWPTVLAVRRLNSWNILNPGTAPAPNEAKRVGEFMARLADCARVDPSGPKGHSRGPRAPRRPPKLPDHPVLHARLLALASALAAPEPSATGIRSREVPPAAGP